MSITYKKNLIYNDALDEIKKAYVNNIITKDITSTFARFCIRLDIYYKDYTEKTYSIKYVDSKISAIRFTLVVGTSIKKVDITKDSDGSDVIPFTRSEKTEINNRLNSLIHTSNGMGNFNFTFIIGILIQIILYIVIPIYIIGVIVVLIVQYLKARSVSFKQSLWSWGYFM